jgi:hypothetical protein
VKYALAIVGLLLGIFLVYRWGEYETCVNKNEHHNPGFFETGQGIVDIRAHCEYLLNPVHAL